ncbi:MULTISPECIES: NepR family anti-sigma factor [Alphaproteobacteria]|nr:MULTISPECIES: NepR family anti-sigma factor [Alphaproteobacteria]
MKTPGKQSVKAAQPQSDSAVRSKPDANAAIAARLRGYYDSIVEEGTPPAFLDLLERLDKAERGEKD